jgi:hypothetical protein
MNKEFLRITGFYTAGVVVVFYMIWALLDVALPEANLNVVRALSTAFGINLPENLIVDSSMGMKAAMVIVIISVLSIGLIVLNVFFSAIVTARFIHPRIDLVTSGRGALSTKWNPTMPYVLVRMSNFHRADLVDVRVGVVLTVEETRDNGGTSEQFLCYLPITEFTPQRVLVMERQMPWSIAVPGDILLSNSLTRNYHFRPGEPVVKSFTPGKKLESVRRTLQILIQGTDTQSYSRFVIHRKIPVDEQHGGKYTLHLHDGSFKSLPLHIDTAEELEQYAD